MNLGLEGRVAIVTGPAKGMGAAITLALAREGVDLSLAGRDMAAIAPVAAQARKLGRKVIEVPCDVTRESEVERLVRDTLAAFGGRIDILVNVAGGRGPLETAAWDTTPGQFDEILQLNMKGCFLTMRAVAPAMRERRWGRIINICSLAMKTGGLTAGTAYTTSKGALGAFTFSLARELAADGVTANGIAPAYIKTNMVTEQLTEQQRQDLLRAIPVGRFCEPEEVAHVVVFLSSALSGFITGEIVDINGGLHLD